MFVINFCLFLWVVLGILGVILLDGSTRLLFVAFNLGFTACIALITVVLYSFFYIEYPKRAQQAEKVTRDKPKFIGVLGWKTGKVGKLSQEFKERLKVACDLAIKYNCMIVCADINKEGSRLKHCESAGEFVRLQSGNIKFISPLSCNAQVNSAKNTVQEINSFMTLSEKLGQKGNFMIVNSKYQDERAQIYAIFKHNIWLNSVLSKDCLNCHEKGAELFKLFCTEANPSWLSVVAWIAQFFVDRTRLNK